MRNSNVRLLPLSSYRRRHSDHPFTTVRTDDILIIEYSDTKKSLTVTFTILAANLGDNVVHGFLDTRNIISALKKYSTDFKTLGLKYNGPVSATKVPQTKEMKKVTTIIVVVTVFFAIFLIVFIILIIGYYIRKRYVLHYFNNIYVTLFC